MTTDDALPVTTELIARLFPRRQVILEVTIDLDPIPGWGDNPEDHRAHVQNLLDSSIGHYHPTVTIEATS